MVAEPLLDIDEIQGNILAGFNKDQQLLLALRIRRVPSARKWLARMLPFVSSLAEVQQFNTLYRMRRKRLGYDPQGMVATWMNLAFTRTGLARLAGEEDTGALPDPPFQRGLGVDSAVLLGDPGGPDPTANWVVGGSKRPLDILMILAGDDKRQLTELADLLRPNKLDGAEPPEVVWEELGETIPSMPGHEHFGFRDGVSQPAVRGLVSRNPDVFLSPRVLNPAPDGQVDFARPGQPLVWPGNFVLGYPHTSRDDGSALDPVPLAKPWFKNGSFLVFRRLNQNVAGFAAFLKAESARQGMAPDRLGALLVGRWPSGAPVSRSPRKDNPKLADNSLANNDFLFTQDTPPPDFVPGGPAVPDFPPALESSNGPICPFAAHIVKVNPRDHDTDFGPPFDTLTRRILRRGIPFGPRLAKPDKGDDRVERGLHFLCYQASIEDQFEFLQQRWANATDGPKAGGHDLIIGQTPDGQRSIELPPTVTAPIQWVTPTGGAYCFAPSISAIRDVLVRGAKPWRAT
jgi:Dyp-type peroxidase family